MNPTDSPPTHVPTSPTEGRSPRGARQRLPFIQPVRIGRDADALAGIYQPASDSTGTGTAVLICNPFGQEAIRAQRSLRVLAERLGRQGIPSLRFDYFGTGDSPGEDGAGHLTRWRQDIHLADVPRWPCWPPCCSSICRSPSASCCGFRCWTAPPTWPTCSA